jgi:hypothetical protein
MTLNGSLYVTPSATTANTRLTLHFAVLGRVCLFHGFRERCQCGLLVPFLLHLQVPPCALACTSSDWVSLPVP